MQLLSDCSKILSRFGIPIGRGFTSRPACIARRERESCEFESRSEHQVFEAGFQVRSCSPTAEARRLERRQCEFKSHREHQFQKSKLVTKISIHTARLPSPTVEAADSKSVRSEFESPGEHQGSSTKILEHHMWVWPNGSGISLPN